MGNDKDGAAGHQGVHAPLDDGLSACVNGGGSLIQDHHRGIGHSGPGNGDELPLALGQVGAVAGEHGVNLKEELLKQYDQVIFMKNGEIVEKGSYNQLKEKQGAFFDFMNLQEKIEN